MQPQMLHLPIGREVGLIGNCWTLGQILLTVLQSNEPLYALADSCRVAVMNQIDSHWQIPIGQDESMQIPTMISSSSAIKIHKCPICLSKCHQVVILVTQECLTDSDY